MITKSYKDLIVWQKAINLVIEVYKLTEKYPKSELFGLTSQIRRSAVAIPSNIAEGRHRGSKKDYRQFLIIAYSSGAELETQLEISKRLSYGKEIDYSAIESLLIEIMKILNKMIYIMN
jgi:four helix bundle protein